MLLDITMPDMDGLEAIPHILNVCPSAKILVLTMHDSGEIATKALAAGASGLVLKSDAAHDLVMAVQAMEKGKPFLSPAVTNIILGHLVKTGKPGPSPSDLTPRELEILKLLAQGRSHKEIASRPRHQRQNRGRAPPQYHAKTQSPHSQRPDSFCHPAQDRRYLRRGGPNLPPAVAVPYGELPMAI